MRTLRSLSAMALAPALLGCSGDFWDRPYGVAGSTGSAAAVERPAAPVPPDPSDPSDPSFRAPVAVPAPPPAFPPAGGRSSCGASLEDHDTLGAVNRIRQTRGLSPFRWNDRLFVAARDHSAEQRLHRYMGHGSPDAALDDLGDRVRFAGYRGSAWAEVVAMGYADVPAVVDGWMRSRGHREILLDPQLEEAAFARDGSYWTGNFGTPLRGAAPRDARAVPPRRPAAARPPSPSG